MLELPKPRNLPMYTCVVTRARLQHAVVLYFGLRLEEIDGAWQQVPSASARCHDEKGRLAARL